MSKDTVAGLYLRQENEHGYQELIYATDHNVSMLTLLNDLAGCEDGYCDLCRGYAGDRCNGVVWSLLLTNREPTL